MNETRVITMKVERECQRLREGSKLDVTTYGRNWQEEKKNQSKERQRFQKGT